MGYQWNSLSSNFDIVNPSGTGTVTSVSFSGDGTVFDPSVQTVTTTGGFTPVLLSQAQNLVFASPNGTSGAPLWRALVAADLPSLSGTYLPLAGGTMSGAITMGSNQIHGLASPSTGQDAVNLSFLTTYTNALFLPLVGGTMSGAINMGAHQIHNLLDPSSPQDAVTVAYLNAVVGVYLPLAGGLMNGTINMQGNTLIGLPTPVNPNDAVNLAYLSNYLPLAGSPKQIVFYSNSGSATSDAAHTIDSVTGEVNLQWISEPNVTSQMLLSGLVTPYGTLPGSWNVTSNSVTNDIAFTGSGDLSAIGGSTESVVIAHVNAATSDLAVVLVDNNGTPSVIMQTLLGGSPTNGLKYIQDNTQIAVQDNGAGGQWFLLDTANFLYQFGDINNSHQHTYLSIDDQLRTFTFNFDINHYTFPYGDATVAGQSMVSNAAGVMSWAGPFATVTALTAYLPLAGGTMLGELTLNPATQVAMNDAATIGQLASFVSGLAWKSPAAQAAATGNVNIAAPVSNVFDGHTVATGESVLLFNQSLQTENGIYVFNGIGVPMVRRGDADTSARLTAATISLLNGTIYGGESWTQITDNPVIGTDPIIFTEIGILYNANGLGIQLFGHTFTLVLDGSTLTQSATGLKVADHQITATQLDATGIAASTYTYPTITTGTDGRIYSISNGTAPITSLNGQTGTSQTFATGTTGTDFHISSSANVHTFNIPDASLTARGLITITDQSIYGNKTFRNTMVATSGNSIGPVLSLLSVNLPADSSGGNVYIGMEAAVQIQDNFNHSSDNAVGLDVLASTSTTIGELGSLGGMKIDVSGNTAIVDDMFGAKINVSVNGTTTTANGIILNTNNFSATTGFNGVNSVMNNLSGTIGTAAGFSSDINNSGTSISTGYNFYAGANAATNAYAFYGINNASRFGTVQLDAHSPVQFYDFSNTSYVSLQAPTTITGGSGTHHKYTLPDAIPLANGYLLQSTISGIMSWVAPGTGFAYVASINGDASSAQTLVAVPSGTGTAFNIVNAGGGVHNFELPDASLTANGTVNITTQSFAGQKTIRYAETSPTAGVVSPLTSLMVVSPASNTVGSNIYQGAIVTVVKNDAVTYGINDKIYGVNSTITYNGTSASTSPAAIGYYSNMQFVGVETVVNPYGFVSDISALGNTTGSANFYAKSNGVSLGTKYAFLVGATNTAISQFSDVYIQSNRTLRFINSAGNFVAFQPANSGVTNGIYTWPTAVPGTTSVLESNSSGTLSWANVNTSFVTSFQTFAVQTNFTNVFTFTPSSPTSGTITQTWTVKSQNPNLIWAGPANPLGGSAAPTFRSMVYADMPALTDGQIYIGSTATGLTAASLTAGTNISIVPGSNSITINATGIGGLTKGAATTGFGGYTNPIIFLDAFNNVSADTTFTHNPGTFTNITQTSSLDTTAYNQSTVQILLAAEHGLTTAAQLYLHNSNGAALTWFDSVGSLSFGFKASDAGAQIQVGATSYYTIPASDGTAGQVLTTAGGFGGLSWTTVSGGGGITTLNTLTAATQTFAIGTTGTDFNIVSAVSTHTFNLPTASATNRGALSSTDWTSFNNRLPTSGGTMTGAFIEAPLAVTTGASQTVNAALANTFDLSLTSPTTTLTLSGGSDGQMIRLRIKQDATGGRLVTWPVNARFGTDISSITLSTGANVTDYVGLMYKAATSTYDVVSFVRGF